jgi:hypothetical protein
MNQSPFWPLVWKEYRTSRSFWLAMAVMGLAAQAGVYWLAHQPANRDWWLYGIALMISAGFAVGIGGTLFAVEHEERTIALLRRLPVRAGQLGAAKVISALAGLIALLAVLWFAASAMAGWQALPETEASQLWRVWGLACLEGLAWGVLYSLAIRSPLHATVAAALTVALVDSCMVMLTERHDFSSAPSVFCRTTLLLLIVLADVVLLPCWLAGHRPRWQSAARRIRSADLAWRRPLLHLAWQTFRDGRTSFLLLITAGPAAFALLAMLLPRPSYFGLIVPGSNDFLLVVAPLALLAALDGALVFRADWRHGPRFLAEQGVSPRTIWFSRQLVWGFWLWALTAFIVCLSSTQLVMLVLMWLNSYSRVGFFADLWHRFRGGDLIVSLSIRQPLLLAFAAWRMLLPAYAAGQLASLLVRRSLLAVTLGLFLGVLAAFWVGSMQMIRASWWWSVLPLPIGFLLATWLRLPSWLVERSGLRSWLAPGAAALLPVAALLVAVPIYRVLQVPEICDVMPMPAYRLPQISEATADVARPASSPTAIADARATLNSYAKAWDLCLANRAGTAEKPDGDADPSTASPADEGWRKAVVDLVIEANRHDSADLAIEASRRNSSALVLPVLERRHAAPRIQELANFLIDFAKEEQKEGKLDAALDAYLATFALETCHHECCGSCPPNYQRTLKRLRMWAAAPGQTAERIRAAIQRLKECHAAFPTPEEWLLPQYEESALTINDLAAAAAAEIVPANKLELGDWISSSVPSERARARRILDWLADYQLTPARDVADALAKQVPLGQVKPGDPLPTRQKLEVLQAIFQTYLPTTPLVERSALNSQPFAPLLIRQETSYRATVIVLALNAWRAEHGQLPGRLDELVPAELDALPVDPPFARPFLYYPHGMPARQGVGTSDLSIPGAMPPGVFNNDNIGFAGLLPLITDEPFLWSALDSTGYRESIRLMPPTPGGNPTGFPYELSHAGEVIRAVEYVLGAGTAYPIRPSQEDQP